MIAKRRMDYLALCRPNHIFRFCSIIHSILISKCLMRKEYIDVTEGRIWPYIVCLKPVPSNEDYRQHRALYIDVVLICVGNIKILAAEFVTMPNHLKGLLG